MPTEALPQVAGLSDVTVKAARLWLAGPSEVSRIVGFEVPIGGLAIPYPDSKFCRVRLEEPFQAPGWKSAAKYLSPLGSANHLYLPPTLEKSVLADPKTPLVITEGEKKALRAVQDGIPCVATPGIWSWLGGESKGELLDSQRILPDFDRIVWRKRLVTLLYDSDISPAHTGYSAYQRLAKVLEARGAIVRVLTLPNVVPDGKTGLDDFLVHRGPDAFNDFLATAKSSPSLATIDAKALMATEFPLPKTVAPGLVPVGLTLLAGRPKSGKSWLVLHLSEAVASGKPFLGSIYPTQGDVLVCALEDNPIRLQGRLEQLLGGSAAPSHLEFATELPRLDRGGLEAIRRWLEEHPGAVLVIIDTLARVRPRSGRNGSLYEGDTDALAPLQKLALEFGVAIVVIHHTRKADAEDVFDTFSGSLGLSGVADALVVLTRKREGDRLHVTGRDIEQQVLGVKFDEETGLWTLNPGDHRRFSRLSPERARVLEVLQGSPKTPIEVARALGQRDSGAIRRLLGKLRDAGQVVRLGDGRYQPAPPAAVEDARTSDQSDSPAAREVMEF